MRSPSSPFLTPRLVVLAAGHFTIDAYSSFFLPLLPLLAQRLGLNYAMVGGLTAMASLSSSFSQPLFGVLSDRMRRPWFVALGPMIAAVFMASIGLAPRYDALVALLVLGGIGVAMFHPQTASLAGASSPDRGMAMSFWVTGGTLGWALGPAYATAIVHQFGLARTWLAAIPGLVMCALLFTWFARVAPRSAVRRERASLAELKPVARPLAMLYFTVVSRSAVSSGFATFLPLWVHARGGSVTQGGWLTTIYLTLGALGGFAGGDPQRQERGSTPAAAASPRAAGSRRSTLRSARWAGSRAAGSRTASAAGASLSRRSRSPRPATCCSSRCRSRRASSRSSPAIACSRPRCPSTSCSARSSRRGMRASSRACSWARRGASARCSSTRSARSPTTSGSTARSCSSRASSSWGSCARPGSRDRSEEHTSELQSRFG